MKPLLAILTILFSFAASANEGVLFNYVLEEQLSPEDITTSEFGFLVDFDKEASADMGNTAKLDVTAHDLGSKVRVNVTLHDYIDGDLTEIGQGSVDVLYGNHSRIAWYGASQQRYELSISAKRHSTP